MDPTIIRADEWDRNKRLRELGLVLPAFREPRWGLLEAVRASVAGRAEASDNDARSIAGINAWNYPTRRLREVFRANGGWEKFEESGVEGIIHPKLKLKVIAVSTDEGTCDPSVSPRNRTPKGPATERITDLNSQFSFGFVDKPAGRIDEYQTWELCTFDDGDDVRAELSCPVVFASGRFVKFSERIFLINPGEWKTISILPDEGIELAPSIKRK